MRWLSNYKDSFNIKVEEKEPEYARHFREFKQKRLDYNIELIKLANKIKEHDPDDSSDSEVQSVPQYSNISSALKVIQFMIDNEEEANVTFVTGEKPIQTSGNLKHILSKVKSTIESGIFWTRSQLPEDLQEEAYDKDASINGDSNLVPYFEVVDKLMMSIDSLTQKMNKKEEQSKSEIKNLKRQIGYKDKNIETLEKQLNQLQQKNTHPIFEQYTEIVNQNEKLLKENNQLQYKVDQFEEDLEELKAEHTQTELELRVVKEEYKRLEREYDKLVIVKEQLLSKITEITENYDTNLRNYQNSLVLLKTSQEIRKKLQKQYELLLEENRRLEVRAAAGFEGLTPRYESFKLVFKKLKIKPPEKQRGCTKRSSNQYIEKLISAYTYLKEST